MNKKRIVIAFIVILSIVALFWWWIETLSFPKEEKADKWLKEDCKHLELVVDYLLASPSDYIYFIDDRGSVYEGYGYGKPVKNDSVLTSIKYLFSKRDYKEIKKTGNTELVNS